MSTIELGEISPEPGGELDHVPWRRLGLAASLLFCLICAASTRPMPNAVRPLWSVPTSDADSTTLGPETLYLHHGGELTAYDLATGAVRWRTEAKDTLGYAQLAGSLLLLPADPQMGRQDGLYGQFIRSTVALSAATGEWLWTAPGEPMALSDDTVLMADYTGTGAFARLRLIRLGDRGTVWQHDATGVISFAFAIGPDGPTRVVTVTDDGLAEVLRFADGGRLARARLPWARAKPEQGQYNDLAASGNHLVVNRNEQGHAELSVYRLDTLAFLWRADGTDGYAFPCGSGICLNNQQGLTAYDADTGRQRWHVPGSGNGWAAGDDRVVVDEPGEVGEQYLIDAGTGARVGENSPGETVWNTEPDEALLVLKPTETPSGRTSIARWDLVTGRREVLGSIDRITVNRCQAVAHYLGCYQNDAYSVTAVGR
ncbi:PQQ-binding-like beta-propeller repeat protein [Actinoplanes sp. CA-142083]|uniref:outer membrane protein assembly factor BamB family protein n=1 Tax=Actinoplanes sp. CA-142083 TaxID=3239903 RepID=UPI003D939EF4